MGTGEGVGFGVDDGLARGGTTIAGLVGSGEPDPNTTGYGPEQPATASAVRAKASARCIVLFNVTLRRPVRAYHRRISNREITKYRDDLLWLLRHVVETLDGLTEAELNWRPPATDANSLLVLATHTLGASEAHVLQLLAGQEIDRVRANEFRVSGNAGWVRARLEDVTQRLSATLDGLDPAELDRERPTPAGSSTGREVLLWAVRHAEQHHAVARLTRDLVLGARPAR